MSEILKLLAEKVLKLNFEKSTFFSKEIKLLGHVISKNQIKMDPDKIKSLENRKPPQNLKQLQQYLGLTNYFHKFVEGYAKIAHPLFDLLKSDAKWEWSAEADEAFELLKKKLTEYPVLRPADYSKPFTIHTDASGYALGYILTQTDDNGVEYVVTYGSRIKA